MRGIHLVAILTVLTLAAITIYASTLKTENSAKCPKTDSTNTTVKLAHENDCTKFYICIAGQKTEKECPFADKNDTRLHFNAVLQKCDSPQSAGCRSGRTIITGTSTMTPTVTTQTVTTTTGETAAATKTITTNTVIPAIDCPKDTEGKTIKLPHETLCDHFYLCTDGEKRLVRCLRGNYFDPMNRVCDSPDKVDCKVASTAANIVRTTTSPVVRNITSSPNNCLSKGYIEKQSLPHECSCEKYYLCIDGELIRHVCPAGLHYDYKRGICDVPEIVKCDRPILKTVVRTASVVKRAIVTQAPHRVGRCTGKADGTRLPHEYDCTLYYICKDGQEVQEKCRRGLHFNVRLQLCDLPENAKCDGKAPPKPNKCMNKPDETRLPHENDCTLYYKCQNGQQVLFRCPEGLHFGKKIMFCDTPENANCDSKASRAKLIEAVIPIEPRPMQIDTCSGQPDGTRLPHEYDCTLYYSCKDGQKVQEKCRRGLHFNERLRVCDFPENAKCDGSIPPTKPTTIPTEAPPKPNKCINKPDGTRLPYENDCTLYYKCQNGQQVLFRCPEGLHFSKKIMFCDTPENANCDGRIPPTKPTTIPTEAPPKSNKCINKPDGTRLPHENDCTLYYKCQNGQQALLRCPEGLHFSKKNMFCDTPENANCDGRIPPTKPTTIPTEAPPKPNKCMNKPDETRLPHENDCTLYYKCQNGQQVLFRCPEGLHFSKKIMFCDTPENANCDGKVPPTIPTERTIPTKTPKPTIPTEPSKPTIPTEPPKPTIPTEPPLKENKCIYQPDGTRLPHENNCMLYYICKDGFQVLHKCPEGLHFSKKIMFCDTPENANCNGKIVPTESPKLTETTLKPISDCDPNSIYQLPHETDCKSYYLCFLGEKSLKKCPRNLLFHPTLLKCDKPEKVTCKKYSDDFKINETKVMLSTTCIGTCPLQDPFNYEVILPNENCRKFCRCSKGLAYVDDCPNNMNFDSMKKVCDYPEVAVCAVRPGNQDPKKDDGDRENGSLKSPNKTTMYKTHGNFWFKLPFLRQYL